MKFSLHVSKARLTYIRSYNMLYFSACFIELRFILNRFAFLTSSLSKARQLLYCLFDKKKGSFRYFSKYETVGVLPIWIVKSNVSSVGSSSERNRRANALNVRLYYPSWQYTNLFILRFVSLLRLPSTLRLF